MPRPTKSKPKAPAKAKDGKLGKKTRLPTQPKTTATTKEKTPRKPSKTVPKYDWSAIRREYIRGDDNVTYKVLSQREGAPAEGSIERRAMNEGWTALRQDFRREVDLKIRQVDVDLKTEVRRRHAGIGKGMTNIGATALNALGGQLKARGEDAQALMQQAAALIAQGHAPDSPQVQSLMGQALDSRMFANLDTLDIIRFVRYGTDLERKALGMEDLNINFRNISGPEDLDNLSEDQLWQLAGQLPPEDDDEDW